MAARLARNIGISLGNIDRFVDGLGEFANQLGSRLARRASALRKESDIQLWYHVAPELVGCFGDEVAYLRVQRHQEWWHRSGTAFDAWLTMNQLNRYPAPAGTRHRVLTVHDLNFLYHKTGFSLWRDKRRMARVLRGCDHVVTISDHVRQDIERYTTWRGPTQTIYNGARDLSDSPQDPVDGLPAGEFVLHISRMSRSKNVEALLGMMTVWPDQLLVLAGPSAGRNADLLDQAGRLGLRNVRVLTMISDAQKAWLYAHCAAFVFPSLTEGFGLPPVEAMHFGKPVVLSRLTCLPEIGADACGYFPDFEPQAMRLAVERTLQGHRSDPGLAAKVKANARRFNWDRCAHEYEGLLVRLACQRQGPR